jgi:hypothetical protein
VRIDRNERVRLMTKFRSIARGSWKAKTLGRHRGERSARYSIYGWRVVTSHSVEKLFFFARGVTLGSSIIRFIIIRRPRWRVGKTRSGV